MDMSYFSCPKKSKILNDDSFIFPLKEISHKGKIMRAISHEKKTHLGKICVTMTDLMDKFYETTEFSDVICEECTNSSGTTSQTNFGRKKNNQY